MSSITLPPTMGNRKVDTYQRTDVGGADAVDMQVVVPGNPFPVSSGSLTGTNQTVTVTNLNDAASAAVQFAGTFNATAAFEGTVDGTNWVLILACRADQNAAGTTNNATNTVWKLCLNGFNQFRVRCSAFTSGSMFVSVQPSPHAFDPTPFVTIPTTLQIAASTAATAMNRTRILAAAGTNAANLKTSAARVFGYQLTNNSTTVKFVKLFAKNTAPTVGTDVPVDVIAIPPNTTVNVISDVGWAISTGLSIAITGGFADNDTTGVLAGEVIGALFWA